MKAIFLYNELLNPQKSKHLNLPMNFATYAYADAKLFSHFGNRSVFALSEPTRKWGNSYVYGAVYLLEDYHFYIRLLDAYHACSMSSLLKNHDMDVHHRVEAQVTPILFKNLHDLNSLKYKEADQMSAQIYLGNPNHPKITTRLDKTVSYRITTGIDKYNFIKNFEEEQNGL